MPPRIPIRVFRVDPVHGPPNYQVSYWAITIVDEDGEITHEISHSLIEAKKSARRTRSHDPYVTITVRPMKTRGWMIPHQCVGHNPYYL